MYQRKFNLLLSLLLVAALSACNLPGGEDLTPTPDLALTVTALAQPQETATPSLPLDTATPEFTAAPESTPTPSVPTVTVSTNTNCRTGPSTQYDLIGGLNVGQSAEVVGKSTSTGYWIIRTPGGGTCWLWGQFATVSGNTANLPEYPTPPTPTPSLTPTATLTLTPSIPTPVNNPTFVKNCAQINPGPPPIYLYQGVLNWEDASNNEDGFNIYRNGALLTSVPANTTSFNLPPFGPFPMNVPIQYGVEAFNVTGKASITVAIMTCP
ncbi:MAG: SH3 domain-containing protein [Anaerolineales bacterium]|nr:MAG: SH3 domain-containing protein [Anaerolineales bacterium]